METVYQNATFKTVLNNEYRLNNNRYKCYCIAVLHYTGRN